MNSKHCTSQHEAQAPCLARGEDMYLGPDLMLIGTSLIFGLWLLFKGFAALQRTR